MLILLYLAIGLCIGIFSGALGIGGGILLLPALVWLCKFTPYKAAGTTLAILVPPIGLPAAWNYYRRGEVDIMAAVWIAVAFAVGGYVGACFVKFIDEKILRLMFGLVMIYIAVRFIASADSDVAAALAGLLAAGLAWVAYLSLRALGRKHVTRPNLGERIRAMAEEGHADLDYHI